MRSTGFVILSVFVHVLAVAAIALGPQRLSELAQGTQFEVKTGEPAAAPGVAEAEKPADPPAQPAAQAEAVATPTPLPQKPKPAVKRVIKKVAVQKAPKAETKPQELPEKLDPAVEDTGVTLPAPEPTAAEETASATDSSGDQETEASSDDVQKAADPSPVGVTEEAPAETSSANAGASNGTGEQLGKGGSTQAGAVEFTNLKQANGNKPPVYPMAARMEKRQGQVDLIYRVTKDGHVVDVSVAQSSGSADLDNEAVRAVSQFRFVPGQEGWAKHPIMFSLKGETAALPSRLRSKVGAQE